jgi:hypothetical protein
VEINDPTNWRVIDPNPGVALADILPISQRALALLARSLSHTALQGEFIRLHGAVDILRALDYHYDNLFAIRTVLDKHVQTLEQLKAAAADVKPGERRILDRRLTAELMPNESDTGAFKSARYEAAAYLGRLGQSRYFATSSFVTTLIGPSTLSRIERLLVFRHKFTAHRSIDKPQGDSDELQTLHAMSLTDNGMIWHPLSTGRQAMAFQIRTEPSGVENFVPEEDHPTIMGEAYDVLSRVLS